MGFNEIFGQYRKLATELRELEVTDADRENYRALLAHGGFSHNPVTGKHPEHGYMVSRPVNHGGVNHQVDLHELTPETLARHRMEAEDAGHFRDPERYQGGWVQNGKAHLDVSHNIQDKDEAIRLGKQHDQKAIYHLDSGEEIDTGGTGNS